MFKVGSRVTTIRHHAVNNIDSLEILVRKRIIWFY